MCCISISSRRMCDVLSIRIINVTTCWIVTITTTDCNQIRLTHCNPFNNSELQLNTIAELRIVSHPQNPSNLSRPPMKEGMAAPPNTTRHSNNFHWESKFQNSWLLSIQDKRPLNTGFLICTTTVEINKY
jgi:hypothetical protein